MFGNSICIILNSIDFIVEKKLFINEILCITDYESENPPSKYMHFSFFMISSLPFKVLESSPQALTIFGL